ncbi:hypothetical protein EDB92DRAFT_1953233 [Lactarius akahatsu]|uniref:TRIP4/RQT4 C2HC5-type zinc finger domain-containing protein n=1 Tax=Lactarius akahatsu TaxID=416441 RepID=A0AAD4L7I5_9AGAM|nr:hypothetical protein EDB92DRAFT_1953233 [Lactarius akahatsu]
MPPRSGTAWTSDRIRPQTHKPSAHLVAQTPSKSDKGKGRAGTPEPPRSTAVRKLDELLAGLRSSSTEPTQSQRFKDNRVSSAHDGCFCQARTHALSEYTPLCAACGLVLCALHPPHRPCPHCTAPLLDPAARAALLVQLEEQRTHTLAEEAAARARAAEELRMAEGAFPALGGAPGAGAGAGGGGAGARVLSLVGQRVVVESYRAASDMRSKEAAEREEDAEDGVSPRVPPPPMEVEYMRVPRGPATRWVASRDGEGAAKYVAPPPVPRGQSDRRGKGKGKARDVAGS